MVCEFDAKAKALVQRMTVEEKAAMLCGRDFWHLQGVPRLGIPGAMVADGPHGLRKQSGRSDHLGQGGSLPATCFPTASALACSFDETLVRQVGEALGRECRREDVSVLLGPGANIKRSPLCGRNFEYFSEDPLLSGRMAAAWVEGVQSQGVGASLKHFAANNQEKGRLITDSVVDARALREIYLRPFELAVRAARPWTVMPAYNLLNGVYCCENPFLLTQVLRGEWGFEGLTLSDWGALSDPLASYPAGLDVEMPGLKHGWRRRLARASSTGELPAPVLDAAAARVTALLLRAQAARETPCACDSAAHLALARRAAAECAVLLKNDGILPAAPALDAAVIGAFAKTPRYQGAGSSRIEPAALDCAWDALCQAGCRAVYAPGYRLDSGRPDPALLKQAADAARGRDIVYLFVGLPDAYESEGYDRATMALPPAHDALVRAVCAANPNTVVVLQGGSPMLLPWAGAPRAILLAYLGGCQGGGGVADVLLGKVCPGGKLAETWPMADGDSPCAGNWPGLGRQAVYTESLYVGYRWYDAAQKQVRWPFGHGLSYTSFSYSGLALSSPSFDAQGEGRLQVECTVVNTGPCAGSEAVQLYIAPQSPVLFKAPRTLQGFCKVRLAPGESARVSFTLDRSAFAHYSPTRRAWQVEPGAYRVELAASSRDIRLAAGLQVHSADAPEDLRAALPCYYAPGRGFHARQFERLYGGPLPAPRPARPYTLDSTVDELRGCFVGRVLHLGFRLYVWYTEKRDPGQARLARESAFDMPVRQFGMAGISMPRLLGLLDWANGHPWRGAFRLIFG